MIKLISNDVKNNIERCNQCIHWELLERTGIVNETNYRSI
jgi:hypothetical protein